MIRKSVFWGLTLVLIAVLVWLIIRARELESQQSLQPVEVVQESKPTATRVLAPQDLEIVQSQMELAVESSGELTRAAALHNLLIRNNGATPYSYLQLKFTYSNRSGKVLATRSHGIGETIQPGALLDIQKITIDDVPSEAAQCAATIIYADIDSLAGPSPQNSTPPNGFEFNGR